jgi:hypothetical protein
MAKAKIHQVRLPDGEIAERSSLTKTYTHAVMCEDTDESVAIRTARYQKELDAAKAALEKAELDAVGADPAEQAQLKAAYDAAPIGKIRELGAPYWAHPLTELENARENVRHAELALARYSTRELPSIHTWCSRQDLADKAAATARGKDYNRGQRFTVVPVTIADKPAKQKVAGVAVRREGGAS